MRRVITQIGQSIYEWLFTRQAQDNMVALAKLSAAVLGTSTQFNGLAVSPTSPASMQVSVAPGEIYMLAALEGTIYGTLAADTTHQIVKQGISLDASLLTLTAPSVAGQSINYLIQATFQETDISVDPTTGTSPVVLQFYNDSNPTVPYSGPNNSGATSNTFRQGSVVLTAKAGISATTGSQVTPSPDSGYVGIAVVTVANGQTTITSGNITAYASAPGITERLGDKISQATGDARYVIGSKIQTVSASVASNALTLNYSGGIMDFRSATLTAGTPVSAVTVPAGSITVPSGATLGMVSGQASRLVLLEAYNAGNPVLCVANMAGGLQLDETNLISPTTISSGATSAGVIYSASSVSANSPYRVVGFIDISEATAGTWATAPTLVQGVGGMALSALSGIGNGQTYQSVTRVVGTTYYNTSGKPISVSMYWSAPTQVQGDLRVNGLIADSSSNVGSGLFGTARAIVPPGASYSFSASGASIGAAYELR
ncbi:hypothetical protein [Herbaspirillum huttiense]|uniref:hypothetical protein n=1 Tax=Herbaspirillum huttiense TaxID=863372 RepID=UPI002E7787EB|nr:hypothetical protein [Herbaspirillum huttiense]MEE1636316.1 hypothetical protein [Herbaspirillum huttiense NC40101]